MSRAYTFAFKVAQRQDGKINTTIDTCVNNTRREAFWSLVRAIAANPSLYEQLNDEEFRDFKDPKTGVIYRIQFHDIRL